MEIVKKIEFFLELTVSSMTFQKHLYIFETQSHKQASTESLRGHRGMSIPVPEQS